MAQSVPIIAELRVWPIGVSHDVGYIRCIRGLYEIDKVIIAGDIKVHRVMFGDTYIVRGAVYLVDIEGVRGGPLRVKSICPAPRSKPCGIIFTMGNAIWRDQIKVAQGWTSDAELRKMGKQAYLRHESIVRMDPNDTKHCTLKNGERIYYVKHDQGQGRFRAYSVLRAKDYRMSLCEFARGTNQITK